MSPFSLRYVCERYEVSPKTVRRYVEQGLLPVDVDPCGRITFDRASLAVLEKILRMRADLGVNLAGIDIILRLCSRIEELQEEIRRLKGGDASPEREGDRGAGPSGIRKRVSGGEITYARIVNKG